jgi:hypothetical protein
MNDEEEWYEAECEAPQQQVASHVVKDELTRRGQWLIGVASDPTIWELRETEEYRQFLLAAQRLQDAHVRSVAMTDMPAQQHHIDTAFTEEVLHCIWAFMDSTDLYRVGLVNTKFCASVDRHVARRIQNTRQLPPLALLRAQEQKSGYYADAAKLRPSVPIPMLLLPRRIIVTNAGDADFNGVYHCTGANGNGFVFTKPRLPPLRCIIAKRFSQEVGCNQEQMCCKSHIVTDTFKENFVVHEQGDAN